MSESINPSVASNNGDLRKQLVGKIMEYLSCPQWEQDLPNLKWCEYTLTASITRKGTFYRTPPTYRDKPEASMFLRMLAWHRSFGHLMSAMIVDGDMSVYLNGSGDEEWVEFVRGVDFKTLSNMAQLIGGGSNALDAWYKALHG